MAKRLRIQNTKFPWIKGIISRFIRNKFGHREEERLQQNPNRWTKRKRTGNAVSEDVLEKNYLRKTEFQMKSVKVIDFEIIVKQSSFKYILSVLNLGVNVYYHKQNVTRLL